jgi:hypothetical protein
VDLVIKLPKGDLLKEELMIKVKIYLLYAVIGLLIVTLIGCQSSNADKTLGVNIHSQMTATEIYSTTVEDGGTGPYSAILVGDSSLTTHTIFRPKDLSVFSKKNKLPIIAWGNGGCANNPRGFTNFLSEVASHGFLVIAIGPTQTNAHPGIGGGGTKSSQLLDAIDWAIAQNSNKTSQYYGKIDTIKTAVIGQSCGGLQALEVVGDPRISTTVICNSGLLVSPPPAGITVPNVPKEQLKKLHSPILYLLGGPSDNAYPNGNDDFSRIEKIAVFMANIDVGHGGTYMQPHGGEFAPVVVAWFKWQLKGDKEAGKMFTGNPCGLAQDKNWKVEKKNIP